MEQMQLALLENQDPRASLDHHTGKDLSLSDLKLDEAMAADNS